MVEEEILLLSIVIETHLYRHNKLQTLTPIVL